MENSVYFVAGAPRSNYTGRVVVYEVDDYGNIIIIDSQRGEQASLAFNAKLSQFIFILFVGKKSASKVDIITNLYLYFPNDNFTCLQCCALFT